MLNQVTAIVEVEDQKIDYYSSVVIRQQFNAHHEFAIRIKYDKLQQLGSFKLSDAQKLIGKSALIKLTSPHNFEVAYEFRGLVCEISMEQSEDFNSDLVLRGYSPTILIDNGPHLRSFYKKNLKSIAQTLTAPAAAVNCKVNISPKHSGSLAYICQYRESAFHFLNRLSADYGEWFFYDGKELFFGKPSKSAETEVTYGADVHNIQLTLKIAPMTFNNFAYLSKDHKVINASSPASVEGLDEYGGFALKESNKIFTDKVNAPVRPRVSGKGDLDQYVKTQKAAMAAGLEVLKGTSDNPAVNIGKIIHVKFGRIENNAFTREDYGKFLVTSIEHHVTENGKYYNSFEAIPSGLQIIPVSNVVTPIAEPQVATVKDNADPDNAGRVRVQMLWQEANNEMTDWVRVMTPDAGGEGPQFAKNRGFVFIPEVGDQVLLCFRYNDPDRPFVLGSIFHGKTGGGNGPGNNTKTLATKSGHMIELNDTDGKETITVTDRNKNKIIISTPDDSIVIVANASINLTATTINMMASAGITMNAGAAIEGAAGTMVTFGAGVSTSLISARDTIIMAGKVLSASGGKNVKVGSGAGANIELHAKGEATFNSKKKLDINSKESSMSGTDKATFRSKETVLEGSSKAVVKGSKVDIS